MINISQTRGPNSCGRCKRLHKINADVQQTGSEAAQFPSGVARTPERYPRDKEGDKEEKAQPQEAGNQAPTASSQGSRQQQARVFQGDNNDTESYCRDYEQGRDELDGHSRPLVFGYEHSISSWHCYCCWWVCSVMTCSCLGSLCLKKSQTAIWTWTWAFDPR